MCAESTQAMTDVEFLRSLKTNEWVVTERGAKRLGRIADELQSLRTENGKLDAELESIRREMKTQAGVISP